MSAALVNSPLSGVDPGMIVSIPTPSTSIETPATQPEFDPPEAPRERGVTTTFCLAYLFAKDETARHEAFERLTRIMLRETKGLYIPKPGHQQEDDSEKYQFIELFLLEELHPWDGKTKAEIEAAADAGTFRYLGRKCGQRVLNEIRNEVGNERRKRIWKGREADEEPPRPEPINNQEFTAILAACDFLSARAKDTALALFDLRELPSSTLTAALAERRKVSVQSARKHIRDLQEQAAAAVRTGNQVALALTQRLAEFIIPAELASPGGLWGEAERETTIQKYQFDDYFHERQEQRPD